jgi:hypothetical protein
MTSRLRGAVSRALAVITASILVGIVALAVGDKVGDSQGPQLVIAIVLGVAGMGLVGACPSGNTRRAVVPGLAQFRVPSDFT